MNLYNDIHQITIKTKELDGTRRARLRPFDLFGLTLPLNFRCHFAQKRRSTNKTSESILKMYFLKIFLCDLNLLTLTS